MTLPPACGSGEQFKRSLAATIRALAGPHGTAGSESALLEVTTEDMSDQRIAALRGRCDALGLRFRYHDECLHTALAPAGSLSRAIFDYVEALRIEVIAARQMKGIALNLAAAFTEQVREHGTAVLGPDAVSPFANALVLLLRRDLLATQLPEEAARLVKQWEGDILSQCRREIAELGIAQADQKRFARLILGLLEALGIFNEPDKGMQTAEQAAEEAADELPAEQAGAGGERGGEDEDELAVEDGTVPAAEGSSMEADTGRSGNKVQAGDEAAERIVDTPAESVSESSGQRGQPQEPQVEQATEPPYHAYTTSFDQVVVPHELIEGRYLAQLRDKLNREIGAHRRVVVRLANRLQRHLKTLRKTSWTSGLDDGLLDTTRLACLIVDPTNPHIFKYECESETRDTVVSFLVDNSNSMCGGPITLAAVFTAIVAQALECCHVSVEILGFTTCDWHGGQAHRAWRTAGKPAYPGRLSDLRHIVYKDADMSWRREQASLGLMLWPELLKENIDGEALLWAHRRLLARPEQRRVLMVISDGVPADHATLSANGQEYLDRHLRQVIRHIEQRSPIELIAIGIGHDVNQYYRRSATIANAEELGDAMTNELIDLLSEARRPAPRSNITD